MLRTYNFSGKLFNKTVRWCALIFGILGGVAAGALYQHNVQTVGITPTKPVSKVASPETLPRSAGSNRAVQIHHGNGNTDGVERF